VGSSFIQWPLALAVFFFFFLFFFTFREKALWRARRRVPSAMQALLGAAFGPSATLEVTLSGLAGRPFVVPSAAGDSSSAQPPVGGAGASDVPESLRNYIFSAGETLDGVASVAVPPGRRLEHTGMRAELKGVVGASSGARRA